MREYFYNKKKVLGDFISSYLLDLSMENIVKVCGRSEVFRELNDFSQRGKMIRGALVDFGISLFTQTISDSVIPCGAALELLQSSLLIHDDIMDNDTKRRGVDTLFHKYSKTAMTSGAAKPYHTGISMGICAGDISFFIAFEILNSIKCNSEIRGKILQLVSREMTYVGIAQMNDVWYGALPDNIREEDILNLYRFKTGRYTFSLPLMVGAYLAGQDGKIISDLGEFGEIMGILFQIKDDELGLHGSEEKLGKPVCSDIIEGKKTIYYNYVMDFANYEEKNNLSKVFGNKESSQSDLEYVKNVMYKYDIFNKVQDRVSSIEDNLFDHIDSIEGLSVPSKKKLRELYIYNTNRDY